MNETKTTEDQLRAEIESLRRQIAQRKPDAAAHPGRPRRGALLLLALVLLALIAAGFWKGYVPRQERERVLAAESKADAASAPVVNVRLAERAGAVSSLLLPGNIQPIAEAPVMARATGYVRKRNADIGDRVAAGQVLAEIETPELNQQVAQARAVAEQASSAVEQAQAALQQGRSNAGLARVTAERWNNLFSRGVVSRQERDTYQAQFDSQQANVQALEKAVSAGRSNLAAVQANVARLEQLLDYQTVRAPFAGAITVRNVDAGALVNEGSTMLFRIAQTDRLRTYVNVPQASAAQVRPGQRAELTIPDRPGRKFAGTVRRTSGALDPSTRTLLVEIEVPNPGGALLPGMYAQVDLSLPRLDPPLVIPGDTLLVRPDGPQVAVVSADGTVHFRRIALGRDFGDRVEVLSGIAEGDRLVVNPSDVVREGTRVKAQAEAAGKK
jgi:RND family efflux transporter MFP subunit